MMTRDFTFRRTETMRPQIQELVDGFLDDMIAGGPPADLVRDFALPLPSLVISLLLGVPYEDHEFFQEKSTLGLDSRSTDEEKAVSIGGEIFGYMFELVARKEREPGDDMITRLLTDYVATGALSRETATMSALIMLQAGHKTTASMIALGTLALLQHPEQLTRLRETDDPAVVANLVEELMRYLTIVHSLVERVAREDLTIAGQLVRSGDIVLMNRPAGNWDAAFVDAPRAPRRRSKQPWTLGLRLRGGSPVHRPEPRSRGTANCALFARTQVTRTAAGGAGIGVALPERERDLRHRRVARHMVNREISQHFQML